jgi:four helix bundle protein
MMTIKPAYKELQAWQRAMTLVEEIYRVTKTFPSDERFGLISQIRRAAVSIPSNVAEEYCRRRTKPYAHHVTIALGSHAELETCLDVAHRLGYPSTSEVNRLSETIDVVGRLLSGLHRALERKVRDDNAGRKRRASPSP